MLDTIFRNGGERRQAETDLRDLLAEVREEREAVRDERAALRVQAEQAGTVAGRLSKTNRSVDELSARSEAAMRRLEKLAGAVEGFELRLRRADELDERLSELSRKVGEAERASKALDEPEGPLLRNRATLDELGAQMRDIQAALNLVREDSSTITQTQAQLRQSGDDLQRSLAGVTAMQADFSGLREQERQLRHDMEGTRELAREARANSTTALDAFKDMSTRLDALAQLQDLSKDAEKRITGLHALAEHVTQRAKSLETQRHTIEHAASETARLSQMVWTMDAQIAKLHEGRDQMLQAEEAVNRIEQIARTAAQDLAAAGVARDTFAKESARMETEARSLLEGLRHSVERLGLGKEELAAMDDRLRSLSGSLGGMESRVQAVLAKDEGLAAALQKAESLDRMFADLRTETEHLAHKQAALEGLTEQLGAVEALGRRTATQHQSLVQAQEDLSGMQRKLDEVQQAHGEVVRLRLKLAQDRVAFEEFEQRTAAMIGRTPEIESRLDSLLQKMALLDQGTESARKLGETTAALDTEISRVAERMRFVEKLDERVNGLFALSRDIEQMMGQQSARRAEVDGLAQQCESLSARLGSAQQQLEGLAALQSKSAPLAAEVARMDTTLRDAQRAMAAMKNEETTAHEQRSRLAGLIEHGIRQAAETADRLRHVQALSEEMAQVATRGDEALAQLSQVQSRQRDVLAQVTLTEDQLQRAEGLSRQLEHRRALLTQAEKSLAGFEGRLTELDRHADAVQRTMAHLADREAMVLAVKTEVEGIHQIASRSKADLQFVTEHRVEVTEMRSKVDELLERLQGTDQKLEQVEAWRRKIDEAQAGADAVTSMITRLQGTLEGLGEQRVVVDDMAEKLARLDLTVQEAQSALSRLDGSTQDAQAALRTLQREREVAEKVEKSIKQLRRPAGASA